MSDGRLWTSTYPTSLDSNTNQPGPESGDTIYAHQIEKLKESVHAVENEVGKTTAPGGSSVRGRLTTIENTLLSGVIAPPTELFANGKLTYFSGWINGMKDDFNNSSIGADWTPTAPVGTSIAEDTSKLRYTITATASIAKIVRPVPFSSVDARIFCELSGDNSSRFSMHLLNDDASERAGVCLVKNPAGANEVWAEDTSTMNLANPPSLSLWLRMLWYKSVVYAFYSTNAVGSPPVDHEWTPAGERSHGVAHIFESSYISLRADNWAGGSCVADVSKWQIVFI